MDHESRVRGESPPHPPRMEWCADFVEPIRELALGLNSDSDHREVLGLLARYLGRGASILGVPEEIDPSNPLGARPVADDLATIDLAVPHLIENVLIAGSPHMIGGRRKSFKSTVGLHMAVALAAGVPLFLHPSFAVPKPRGVIVFVGEGGRRNFLIRAKRISTAYGLDAVPDRLHYSDRPFAMTNVEHRQDVQIECLRVDAALALIDPFYRYRGSMAGRRGGSGDVFDMGEVLATFSDALRAIEVTPGFVHHFSEGSGGRLDLSSLTMAGSAEFADSWTLLGQDAGASDPSAGVYKLDMIIGNRWGYGQRDYRLHYIEGVRDEDTGEWSAPVGFDLARARTATEKAEAKDAATREAIVDVLHHAGQPMSTKSAPVNLGETVRVWD